LDGNPLAGCNRILLTVVGDADNTSERWRVAGWHPDGRPARYVGRRSWGHVVGRGPVLVEPVSVQVTLERDAKAPPLDVHALSSNGSRARIVPVERTGSRVRFVADGGKYHTIYYELAAR